MDRSERGDNSADVAVQAIYAKNSNSLVDGRCCLTEHHQCEAWSAQHNAEMRSIAYERAGRPARNRPDLKYVLREPY
jgi:hypothetical protein